jgi:hypothetical protein
LKKLISLAACAMLVAACSKKNDPIANAREAAKDKDLQGTFVSECSTKPLSAVFTGLMTGLQAKVASSRVTYNFTGANTSVKTENYSSGDCTGDAAFTYEEKGTFSVNKDQKYKSNDGGYLIDVDYDNLKVTMVSDEGIKVANATKLCGISDWAQNKERDVSAQAKDASCYNSPIPRHVSNRYRVDDKVLYLGTAAKGDTRDNQRPAHLDMGTKYRAK